MSNCTCVQVSRGGVDGWRRGSYGLKLGWGDSVVLKLAGEASDTAALAYQAALTRQHLPPHTYCTTGILKLWSATQNKLDQTFTYLVMTMDATQASIVIIVVAGRE